jgi:tetratricopeptide (TPR) repeat protein
MEKAEEAIQKAIVLNPLSDYADANPGRLYLLQKQYDEAVAAGEMALELNPNGATILFCRPLKLVISSAPSV